MTYGIVHGSGGARSGRVIVTNTQKYSRNAERAREREAKIPKEAITGSRHFGMVAGCSGSGNGFESLKDTSPPPLAKEKKNGNVPEVERGMLDSCL